jgi:hypothetical protein
VSVSKVLESEESLVIQGMWPDSREGATEPGPGRDAACAREPRQFPGDGLVGLGSGPTRPPLVNDHPRRPGGSHCAALSAHHRFHLDRGGLRATRGVRRRPLQPAAELPLRALPDRGAGHGERLLLSPGGDLRRARAAGARLLCDDLQPRLCDPDAGLDNHRGPSVVISLLLSPETKGKVLVPDLVRGQPLL